MPDHEGLDLSNCYAAIDMGSNAIRLVIGGIGGDGQLKVLKRVRAPVRLGKDVFTQGLVTPNSLELTRKALREFQKEIGQFNVKSVSAAATSAVREASNSAEMIQVVHQELGVDLKVIDFRKEAELIFAALDEKVLRLTGPVLLMDIGGGSVEFAYAKAGKIQDILSLPLGTVRTLLKTENGDVEKVKAQVEEFRPRIAKFLKNQKGIPAQLVGTGGNIECLGKLRKQLLNKSRDTRLRRSELVMILALLEDLGYDGRVGVLGLRSDRADVIIPASYVVKMVMEEAGCELMEIPSVGLKEGLLYKMLQA